MLSNFRAFQMGKRYYRLCRSERLPPHLHDQITRAASSICLNLAEGSAKSSPKEQRRFYEFALGSLRECQAIIEIEDIKNPDLVTTGDHLGGMLFNLIKRKRRSPKPESETETKTESVTGHS